MWRFAWRIGPLSVLRVVHKPFLTLGRGAQTCLQRSYFVVRPLINRASIQNPNRFVPLRWRRFEPLTEKAVPNELQKDLKTYFPHIFLPNLAHVHDNSSPMWNIFFFTAFCGLAYLLLRRELSKKVETTNKVYHPSKEGVTFQNVKGISECIEEVQEVVMFLKQPEKFTRLGGKLPKGVLLSGPPGCGKTLLARAIASEAEKPFVYTSGSEFEEMYVGVGAKRVRNLFQEAKKLANEAGGCLVFIDEVDALGVSRSSPGSHVKRQTLNQLLVEMDGFEGDSGIVVVAATNFPEGIDTALLRPGRFDKQVFVPHPDVHGREEILELFLKGKPLDSAVDVTAVAKQTVGLSGADLELVVNEAAILATQQKAEAITSKHLDQARDRVVMGSARKSFRPATVVWRTAVHEAGHALVSLCSQHAPEIHKITVLQHGGRDGGTTQLVPPDAGMVSRRELVALLDVAMGGRVAEELVFGEDGVTTNATEDFTKATELVRNMVLLWGMSPTRTGLTVSVNALGRVEDQFGPTTRQAVDDATHQLLADSLARVQRLLKKRQKDIRKLAEALVEQETMNLLQVKKVLDPL